MYIIYRGDICDVEIYHIRMKYTVAEITIVQIQRHDLYWKIPGPNL